MVLPNSVDKVTGQKIPMNERHNVHRLLAEQGRQQSISCGIIHATRSAAQGVIEWCCSRG